MLKMYIFCDWLTLYRSHGEMLDGQEDEQRVKMEPSSKRRMVEDTPGDTSTETVAAYRVQFFLNKFELKKMKPEALLKMENFLRHNFSTNLLKIPPEHIIGVKCHRQVPPDVPLPEDTVICEVIMFNTEVNGSPMKQIVDQFQGHLRTMDFSSWKIYVGSQFVTVQALTYQNLLMLLKQLGLTTGGLNNVDTVLKIMEQTPGFMESAGDETKHHRSSSKKHRNKGGRHRPKRRKRSHRSDRKRKDKERDESSSSESEQNEELSSATEVEQSGTEEEGTNNEEETDGDAATAKEDGGNELQNGGDRGSHKRKRHRRHRDRDRSRDKDEHRRERRKRDSRDRRKKR